MGKGIIFVGGGNLNRNRDQQSMYTGNKRNQYTKQNSRREAFYKELCLESKKLFSIKARNKKIKKLSSKYQNSACSEKTMEKVFIAYFECIQKPLKKKALKLKLLELPDFLEKNNVDKRIIKRIIAIEEIEEPDSIDKGIKKRKVKQHVTIKEKRK